MRLFNNFYSLNFDLINLLLNISFCKIFPHLKINNKLVILIKYKHQNFLIFLLLQFFSKFYSTFKHHKVIFTTTLEKFLNIEILCGFCEK